MIFDNQKLTINITGKEYLKYQMYKDSKRIKFNKKQVLILTIMGGIILIGIVGIIAIEAIFAEPVEPTKFTWNGILMFLAVAAGIGWIFHGTGFLLVRR